MTGIGSHHSPTAGTTTWLTPPEIVPALGEFDLDPCAAPSPRPWETAKRSIELPEDGLTASWDGRIWCNPPYGRETAAWLEKMADHGNGIALVFARTETDMFIRHVWRRASAILFLHGRLHFHDRNGERAKANSGGPSCLISYDQPGEMDNARTLASSGLAGSLVWNVHEVEGVRA